MPDAHTPVPVLDYAPPPPESILGELKVVAWLLIAFGALATAEVVWGLFEGRVSINLMVLGLFIGGGLLRRSRGWRTCALNILAIILVLLAIGFIVALIQQLWLMVVMIVGMAGVSVWQLRVLTRPDIARLFQRRKPGEEDSSVIAERLMAVTRK